MTLDKGKIIGSKNFESSTRLILPSMKPKSIFPNKFTTTEQKIFGSKVRTPGSRLHEQSHPTLKKFDEADKQLEDRIDKIQN